MDRLPGDFGPVLVEMRDNCPALDAWRRYRISDNGAGNPIPQGSMRVGPNTDAIVWRTCPTHTGRPE